MVDFITAFLEYVRELIQKHIVICVMVFLFLIFAFSAWRSYQLNGGYSVEWESGFWQNFSTEVLGAMATFVLLELIVNRNTEEKNLLLQIRSSDNATALNALARLREMGWRRKKTLRKHDLRGANLQGADLEGLYLRWCNLKHVPVRFYPDCCYIIWEGEPL